MPLVTPQGFQPIPETIFAGLDAISGANAVDLPNDVDANAFAPQLRDVATYRALCDAFPDEIAATRAAPEPAEPARPILAEAEWQALRRICR